MRQGSDMKAVSLHRRRAEICKGILELHGHYDIVAEVRRTYGGFAKANHRGWEHNASGLGLALIKIDKVDGNLGRIIREACGLKIKL